MNSNLRKKNRLLIVADFVEPFYVGGVPRHVKEVYDFIEKYHPECKLDLLCKKPIGKYSKNYSPNSLKKFLFYSTTNILKIILRLNKYSQIIIHHPTYAIIIVCLSKILKVKTIYFFHGPFHLEYKLKEGVDNYFGVLWRFYFQKLFLFIGDEIWVHSKYMEIEARKIYPSSKIRYINPYVDVNKFVNKLHGVDDKSIKIFTCRRLTPRTGVLELIADLNNSSIINYNLTIAGTGELLPRVKALASSKIMILGYLEDKDLIMEYRKCSLYLLPSINLEGFGYVILEAYAMGKPVVASTSSGGGADFVRQFTPDLLYTVNDPSSLEKAINVAISGKYNASYFKEIAIEYDIKSLAKNYLINSSCGARFHQSA